MIFNFSEEKNRKLIVERNIRFEEIIAALNNGQLIEIIEHNNRKKYPNQKIYIVEMNDYIYLVPFIETNENEIFLKTIIPNRKATKLYKQEEMEYEQET